MSNLIVQVLDAIPISWRALRDLVDVLFLPVLLDLTIGFSLFFDLLVCWFLNGLLSSWRHRLLVLIYNSPLSTHNPVF